MRYAPSILLALTASIANAADFALPVDASWSGATVTLVASRDGTQLGTGSGTIAQLAGGQYKASATIDLSGAGAGEVTVTVVDASGNMAAVGSGYYVNASGTLVSQLISAYDPPSYAEVQALTNALPTAAEINTAVEAGQVGTDAAAAKTRVELALPNAAADGAGGLAISDAGGLDLDAMLADTAELQGLFTTGGTLRLLFPGSTIAAASDVSAIGTASDRSLRRPADAFIFRVARRSDGTYTTDRTLRLRPGTTESIRIGLDMSRLAPRQFVYSVGTPSVSAGSLTATSPERYDELATYVVGGTATASESRTIDVTVTMEQGDVFNVTLPVEVFAD